jgi:hypothetical protein
MKNFDRVSNYFSFSIINNFVVLRVLRGEKVDCYLILSRLAKKSSGDRVRFCYNVQ